MILEGNDYLYNLPPVVKVDAMAFLCGKQLGFGVSRTVFVCKLDETKVIKIEHNQARNQNASEWSFWDAVRHNDNLKHWFAPCYRASEMNALHLQARTQPVTLAELRAKCPKVPYLFNDLKVGNWGRIGKRYVCHDYGIAFVPEHGFKAGARLVKAKWWE